MKMDNNFNMQQSMNQQVPQQPMEQSMYYQIPQQRKKKTGLIIAIVSAAVVCILVTIFATVMMQKSRIKNADIVGTWVDDDGNSITFKKGNTGTIDIKEYGMSFNIKWEKEDEIIKISLIYMGQVSEVQEWTIVNFKDKEMTLKYDGSAEVFKKKK